MLLVDTSVLIELPRVLLPDEPVALSALSYAELAFGVETPRDPAIQRARRERLSWLDSLGLQWLPFDTRAGDGYARVANLVTRSRPRHARSKDVLMAGHAASLGASIATLNPKDFQFMAELVPVVVPRQPGE